MPMKCRNKHGFYYRNYNLKQFFYQPKLSIMRKFLHSLTLLAISFVLSIPSNAQNLNEDFSNTPFGQVPAGWIVASNTGVQDYKKPGACSVADKGLLTPGVGKSAPTGILLPPTTLHTANSDIKVDFSIYVFDAKNTECTSMKEFPCRTYVQAYIVPTSWSDPVGNPLPGEYYAIEPRYLVAKANTNNTIVFNNVSLPAGVTEYRVLLNFKTADNDGCQSGGTKFIFDDFKVTGSDCNEDCQPVANADYFNADAQGLFQQGATSFKGNLIGGYAKWASGIPAEFSLASLGYAPAINSGTDFDFNNSPLSAVTYAYVPNSLVAEAAEGCLEGFKVGSIEINKNGTFTFYRGSICVTRVSFMYTLQIGSVVTSPVKVVVDMPGERVILPVTYKSFTATRSSKSGVVLEWETAMEEGNRGFHVQRNIDGNWKNVAFVFSQAEGGNSSAVLKYAYKDVNSSIGISQYRILQVDMDGKGRYSEVRSVRGEAMAAKVSIFPNPSNTGSFNILFEDGAAVRDVVVMDVSGRTVKQFKSVSANSLSVSVLNDGFYTVQVINRSTGVITAEKVIIKKR